LNKMNGQTCRKKSMAISVLKRREYYVKRMLLALNPTS
jgi:hypothetical protein